MPAYFKGLHDMEFTFNSPSLPPQDLIFGASVYFPPYLRLHLLVFSSGLCFIGCCATGFIPVRFGIQR